MAQRGLGAGLQGLSRGLQTGFAIRRQQETSRTKAEQARQSADIRKQELALSKERLGIAEAESAAKKAELTSPINLLKTRNAANANAFLAAQSGDTQGAANFLNQSLTGGRTVRDVFLDNDKGVMQIASQIGEDGTTGAISEIPFGQFSESIAGFKADAGSEIAALVPQFLRLIEGTTSATKEFILDPDKGEAIASVAFDEVLKRLRLNPDDFKKQKKIITDTSRGLVNLDIQGSIDSKSPSTTEKDGKVLAKNRSTLVGRIMAAFRNVQKAAPAPVAIEAPSAPTASAQQFEPVPPELQGQLGAQVPVQQAQGIQAPQLGAPQQAPVQAIQGAVEGDLDGDGQVSEDEQFFNQIDQMLKDPSLSAADRLRLKKSQKVLVARLGL